MLASIAFFTLTSSAEAYRPLTTNDAGMIEKGKWQLEGSWDFSKSTGIDQQHVFLLVPGYGATDFLELDVSVPVVLIENSGQPLEAGIGDILVAPKFSILKEKGARPGLAALLFFRFDTGNERPRIGIGYRETGVVIALSKTLWRFRLNTMIGGAFPVSDRNQKDDAILYGLALDCHIADIRQKPFYLAAEVFGNTNPDPAVKSDPVNLFFGMLYELSQTVSLDTGVSIGMTQAASDLRTTLGATFSF